MRQWKAMKMMRMNTTHFGAEISSYPKKIAVMPRIWAELPTNQWSQLKMGRFLAVGAQRHSAMKGWMKHKPVGEGV